MALGKLTRTKTLGLFRDAEGRFVIRTAGISAKIGKLGERRQVLPSSSNSAAA